MGRTSGTGLGADARESMGRELCKLPKSESSGVHFYVHPRRKTENLECGCGHLCIVICVFFAYPASAIAFKGAVCGDRKLFT